MAPHVTFWFDPVCPFAWMTSKWVRTVAELRELDVEWRFISLRVLNADNEDVPPEYRAGHLTGARLLRVAARARAEHGNAAVGRLYAAYGDQVFETEGAKTPHDDDGVRRLAATALGAAGLPTDLLEALDDETHDELVVEETQQALAAAGRDVGTPIIRVGEDGPAFFGPVISRLPRGEDALRLWDHVVGLAQFPGFAELKRSLREMPQLPAFGVAAEDDGERRAS